LKSSSFSILRNDGWLLISNTDHAITDHDATYFLRESICDAILVSCPSNFCQDLRHTNSLTLPPPPPKSSCVYGAAPRNAVSSRALSVLVGSTCCSTRREFALGSSKRRQRGLRSGEIGRQRRERKRVPWGTNHRNRDALIMGLRKQCCPVSNRLLRYPDAYPKPRKMQQLHIVKRLWFRMKSLLVSWPVGWIRQGNSELYLLKNPAY